MSQNRASGINIIGDAPWGTHFCQFYQTKEDLIDILVPYFKAGLENNEFCMWVTSEPLGVEEAKEALQKSIPDFNIYLEKGQIEIIPYTYWYVIEGVFDSNRVLKGWVEKLNQALANGYDGLRLSGNTFWLEKEDWNGFVDYEEKIDRVLGNYNIIALCTYSLDRCSATDIIDVVANHQFALIKKEGKWEQIESPQRKRAEESLRKSEESLRLALDAGEMGIWDRDFRTDRTVYNERLYELLGLDPEGIIVTGDTFFKFIHNDDLPRVMKHVEDLIASGGSEFSDEFRIVRQDGQVIWLASKGRLFRDKDGQLLRMSGVNYDITERKRAEEILETSESKLRLAEVVASLGHWEWDLKSNEVFWSEGNYRVLGYPVNGLKPSYELWHARVHPDDIQLVEKTVFDAVRDGRPYHIDYRVLLPDCTVRHISDGGNVLEKDASGNIAKFFGTMQDITERKLAEEELKGSEERYRELFESSVDGIIITDLAGNILRVNHAYAKMLGYSMEELRHFNYQQLTPTRWHESEARIVCEQIFEHGYSNEYEKEYIRKDGSILPISISVWLSRDKQGQPQGMWGLVRDITEHKRLEETLQKSENELERAQQISQIGSWTWDINTDEMTWSKQSYRNYGLVPGEVKPSYELFMSFIVPKDRERVDMEVQKAIESGHKYSVTYNIIRRDGTPRILLSENEIVMDELGKVVLMYGTNQDITERKRTEEVLKKLSESLEEKVKERTEELENAYNSLKESEERLAESQKIAHVGGWELNIATGELFWSDEVYRIFGFDPGEFKPTRNEFLNLVHPEDRKVINHAFNESIKGNPSDIFYRIILANGEERVVYALGKTIFDGKNTPVRVRGVVQDITELKKTEEALERIDKIRIKEIHHRIKNNLQVISSLLDLQAEKFAEENVKEAFREGQNRVISMSLLHEELYKGEGNDTLDFSSYIQKLAGNLFSTYNLYSKDVRLIMDLEDNAFLDMDTAVPLGIIVNELVSNSLKHAFNEGEEGEIRILLCRNKEMRDGIQKSIFSLTISDNGKGIPDDMELESIESLGLQLVGILVDQLDGELELRRDNGTEFTIKFDVTQINISTASSTQLVDN